MRHLLAPSLLVALAVPAADASAACEPEQVATPVPQFRDEAPGISLWPLDENGYVKLRPAPTISKDRDSTDYITQTLPGKLSGHEMFRDLAVIGSRNENATQQPWLVMAYNAGIQIWNVEHDPEDPSATASFDLWNGEWLQSITGSSEVDTYLYALDALEHEDKIYIGTAGDPLVGCSAWLFDPAANQLRQLYQDVSGIVARDVRLVSSNGSVFAFVGRWAGVRVYDFTAADSAGPCLDTTASQPCGVQVGEVAGVTAASYLDVTISSGRFYLAVSDPAHDVDLEIWEIEDPADPTTAERRFAGPGVPVFTPTFFTFGGGTYLAFVAEDELRIHAVDACLDTDGCEDLGAPVAVEDLKWKEFAVTPKYHFLDLSFSRGVPYLHYGMQSTGMFGSGWERLWDVSDLPAVFERNTLPELTDGGGSYVQTCDPPGLGEPNAEVDYFGDYYPANEHGLAHFMPRHALFNGPYLYRAAQSVFDVHVRIPSLTADFSWQPSEAYAGEELTFRYEGEAEPSSYGWDFDDDGAPDSQEAMPTWAFAAAGEHPVTLEVGLGGRSDTKTQVVTVLAQASDDGGSSDAAPSVDGGGGDASEPVEGGGSSAPGPAGNEGDGCACTAAAQGETRWTAALWTALLACLTRRRKRLPPSSAQSSSTRT